MENNITELVFILDRSGSMSGLELDTVGGFNAFLEKQRQTPGICYVSTVLFDNDSQVIHDRVPLEQVRPMTRSDFQVRGCTALLDALGGSIRHISGIRRYLRPEDVPQHTVFVIMTDGQENASSRYGSEEVKRMIRHETEKYGWEFLFLASNIDAVETAAGLGIRSGRAVNYRATGQDTREVYAEVSSAVCQARCSMPIEADWGLRVTERISKKKN